jgi:hypothetical protein
MVTFRCKWSNNLLNVEYDFDIAEMRKHPDYEEVKEQEEKKTEKVQKGKNTKED